MAVPEQTPYSEYTGNGVTKSFSLGFICESKDHLIVLVDDIEPPISTWSLSGGNVVFTTAPASGKKIILQRNTAMSRTANYQGYNNSFRPETINKDIDRVWWKLQELGVADWLLGLRIDKEVRDRIAADIYHYTLITKETDQKLRELTEYIEALVNNITGQAFLPILDKYIKTWSGRTQEEKNRDVLSFEDFLRDTNSATVQAAFNSRKTLTLQNKVYDMGNAKFLIMTPENSNMVLNGNGATLKFRDTTFVGGSRIKLVGSKLPLPNLLSDVEVNVNVINFATAHDLKVGDLLSIQSDRLVEYAEGATTRYIGELLTVAKVTSPTAIITHEQTVYAYRMAINAKLFKYNAVENVTLKDLIIDEAGLDPAGVAVENQRPIALDVTRNCLIDNVRTTNSCGQSIVVKDSYAWTIRDCSLEQEQIDDVSTWSQYGVAIVDFSRSGRIDNLRAKGFKTAVSFTDSGAGYGVSINTTIDGLNAVDCSRIVSMHANTRDLKVYNVDGDGCTRGMNIRCADVKIRNFHMKRSKNFQGQGATLFELSNVARDLDIADVSIDFGTYGITTAELGAGYAFSNISIKRAIFKNIQNTVLNLDFSAGNRDIAEGFELVDITLQDCRGADLVLKGNFLKPIVTDNNFGNAEIGAYACTIAGSVNGIFKRNMFGRNQIPFQFSDLSPTIPSANNLVEDNIWERDSNIAAGTPSQVTVRSNTRVVLGGNNITDLSSFTYRVAEGAKYLTSSVANGSLRTLTGGNVGDTIVIRATSGILTIQNTGNIVLLAGEVVLDSPNKLAQFLCVGTSWIQL